MSFSRKGFLQLLTQLHLQLGSGVPREGDGNHLFQPCLPFPDEFDNAGDQDSGLPRSSGRLNDVTLREVSGGQVTLLLVHEFRFRLHSSLSSVSSLVISKYLFTLGSFDLRLKRILVQGPQIVLKSQYRYLQFWLSGTGIKIPSSIPPARVSRISWSSPSLSSS